MTNSPEQFTVVTGPGRPAGRPILVGVDGSVHSRAALATAARLATALGTPLHAIAAWTVPTVMYDAYYPGSTWTPESDITRALLEATEDLFGDDVPEWFSSTTRFGRAAKVLIEASDDAEMLVVGSRGHGGFAGLLLGSVSSACVAHARCTVVVVHGDRPGASE